MQDVQKQILYNVLSGLGQEGTLISNVFADRKVSAGEAFQLIASAPNLITLLSQGTEAIKEYQALSGEEKEQAAAYLGAALNLSNAELDAKIDKTLIILARTQANVAEVWSDVVAFKAIWG